MKLHELEMNTFKIKLENMFSNTDNKNEMIDIMQELLSIDSCLLSSYFKKPLNAIDDFKRHSEMAWKIAPKNSRFLLRNENHF